MKCKKGYEVEILSSPAGYYLGTTDEDGLPNCRISTQYTKKQEDAHQLVADRQHNCIENEFCNGGTGCFKKGVN
jgi:hypothetical protein